jgi:hypothetical protein
MLTGRRCGAHAIANPGGTMQSRSRKILVLGAAAFVLAGAGALAASPKHGASYRGSLTGSQAHVTISFHVSADGSAVEDVALSKLPIYCTGNAPPGARIVFKPAKISAAGTFSTTGADTLPAGPLKGQKVATLALSGAFAAGGVAHGVLTTTYSGPAAHCGGKSSYSTRAS